MGKDTLDSFAGGTDDFEEGRLDPTSAEISMQPTFARCIQGSEGSSVHPCDIGRLTICTEWVSGDRCGTQYRVDENRHATLEPESKQCPKSLE